jgi:peptidoglycan-associated lipoprotein
MQNVMKSIVILLLLLVAVTGCNRRRPPVAAPLPPRPGGVAPPPDTAVATTKPQPVDERLPVPPQPIDDGSLSNKTLDDLNRDSPLQPVFFPLDSADLDDAGRATATKNAEVLKKFATWAVTIEGHADERGSAEYNLALGERRAVVVKTLLVSLGVPADRIRTVSYGKEFPFDPGHEEDAWSKNRRAHFVITAR